MAKKNDDTPTVGRPTMFDEKLDRNSFTAPNGHMEFLRRVGRQNSISAGIRVVIAELVNKDERYKQLMRNLADDGYNVGNVFDELI